MADESPYKYSAYGYYMPAWRRIAVRHDLRDVKVYSAGGSSTNYDMIKEVVYHETGHAVDMLSWGKTHGSWLGSNWSDSLGFEKLWSADKSKHSASAVYSTVTPGKKTWIEYARQIGYDDSSLKREAVADIYYALMAPDVKFIRQGNFSREQLLKEFPGVVEAMRKKMGIK